MPATYDTEVTEQVAAELRKLGSELSKPIGFAIRQLESDPRPVGSKKIRPARGQVPSLYRIHVDIPDGAAYRVIYSIDDGKLTVVAVAVRLKSRHTYKNLEALQRVAQEFLQDCDEGL